MSFPNADYERIANYVWNDKQLSDIDKAIICHRLEKKISRDEWLTNKKYMDDYNAEVQRIRDSGHYDIPASVWDRDRTAHALTKRHIEFRAV